MAELPIFPLGTVLVPGQVLPLQLFEPRYLRLHADLLARPAEERAVGILLIRHGHEVGQGRQGALASVGCEGVLAEHRELRVDGRALVAWALQGRRRFRVEELQPTTHDRPYPSAEVTWLDEGGFPDESAVEDHARAARAGLSVMQRQQILECDDAEQRSALARRLIREEEHLQRRFSSRPAHEAPGGFNLN